MNPKNIKKNKLEAKNLTPAIEALRVAVPYFVVGCLWIFFSDKLLEVTDNAATTVLISNLKGWLYVTITAALLWLLVQSRIRQIKLYQAHVADSEARFRLLVESAPDAVFVQVDYRFAYVNQKTVDLFGAKTEYDLLGEYIPDHLAEDFKRQVIETIKVLNDNREAVPVREEVIIRLDGVHVDVEVSAVPIKYEEHNGALVFMRDITQRKAMENVKMEMEIQLRHKQKLESLGILAGGVAHEINNPITGIINYAQLITENPAADEQTMEFSREIMNEGRRVADIVKNLLSFARQEKQTHSPAQIKGIIDETLSLIHSMLRKDHIDLIIRIPETLPDIMCSRQQIRQVLMNIITNARDALNAKYPDADTDKKLILECSSFEKDGEKWLRVIVEDHGTGIPDDILGRIMDPFFTTKPHDEGTGLGLSISHGIVKDHRGELYFETVPGRFTKAFLDLPAQ